MDMDTKVDREILRHAVSRKMFCDVTKDILDVTKTIGLEVTYRSGTSSWFLVTAAKWPEVEGNVESIEAMASVASVKIYNGPQLFGRKKVTK